MFGPLEGVFMSSPTASDFGTFEEIALLEAFLDLVAEVGWTNAKLSEVSARTSVSLGTLRAQYADRTALLEAYARKVDVDILGRPITSPSDNVRERLFDLLMERFDLARRHRAAVSALRQAAVLDPLLSARLNRSAVRSLEWMLRAAGAGDEGLLSTTRAQALAILLLPVIDTWLKDDDAGMARTMARLDKELRRAEQIAEGADQVLSMMERIVSYVPGFDRGSAAPASDEAVVAQGGRDADTATEVAVEVSSDAALDDNDDDDDGDLPTIADFEKAAKAPKPKPDPKPAPKPRRARTKKPATKTTDNTE